ncbi:MAG: heme-binding protein, partial [Bilophila wadsworthia]
MEHILSTRVLLAVLNGLEAEARGGAPVCLAIVNCGGGLAALLTMDGTPERAVSIAQGKAYTALRMESSTKDF